MATVRLIIRGQTLENPNSGFRVTLDARDFNHDDREGTLPPLPASLVEALEAWRSAYGAQEEVRSHCRIAPGAVTRRSIRDINQLAEVLEQNFNAWLRSTDRGWVRIRELLVCLAPQDPRLLLDCGNHSDLKRLPWQEWELFIDHYRRADAALRMVNDSRQPLPDYPLPRSTRVRILAVVGDCTGINATQDLACVTRLQSNDPKRVEVVSLWQPTPAELQQALEQSAGFHIFIYVGHSRSREDGQVGWLLLNPQDELSIRDFHRAMGQAIQRGLQLVILNSCDGLGLAQQLANLDLPYCLVMKEPVPDEVAVEFIDRFLRALLEEHQSLQGAVRQARHGLESFNSRYSQVTWLPTVCMKQNAPPLTWQALLSNKKLPRRTRSRSPMVPGISYSLMITILGLVAYLGYRSPSNQVPSQFQTVDTTKDLQEKLITDGTNPEFIGLKLSELSNGEDAKRAIEEFSSNNYQVAHNLFSQLFEKLRDEKDANREKDLNPGLPQFLIFSNNACVRQRQQFGQPIYTIVAAGPITDSQGREFPIGTQMLRGIAQVQDEAVKCDPDKRYPNSVPQVNLQVLVANDFNIPEQAGRLAEVLVADRDSSEPLAVVGHYISDATCEALRRGYSGAGIPLIVPLSTRSSLLGNCGGSQGDIFRNTSSTKIEASTIIKHIGSLVRQNSLPSQPRVAILYNREDGFSQDLFKQVNTLLQANDRIVSEGDWQLKDINDPEVFLQKPEVARADVLIVLADGKNTSKTSFNNAVELIKADKSNKVIYGSNPIYSTEVISDAKGISESLLTSLKDRLFIPTDWHKVCAPESFNTSSQRYWRGTVNRVTALSYEAVYVILAGLKPGITRGGLKAYLAGLDGADATKRVDSPIFTNKTISFDPDTGDRHEIQERVLTTVGDNPKDPFVVVEGRCP